MVLTSARFIFSFVFISATSFDGYFRFAGVYRARELVVTVDVTTFSAECAVREHNVTECTTLEPCQFYLSSETQMETTASLAQVIRSAVWSLGESPVVSIFAHAQRRLRGAIF